MLIREIEEKDNTQVELLIRTCLIEFAKNNMKDVIWKPLVI